MAPSILDQRIHRLLRAGGGALELATNGDWRGLLARMRHFVTGRRELLPEELQPHHRTAGPRVKGDKLVVMVTPSLARDGAPLSQFELAAGLARKGLRILTLAPQPGPLAEAYRRENLVLEIWPTLRADPAVPTAYERDVRLLANALNERQCTLLYSNTVDMFAAVDAARASGIVSLWNIREGEPWRSRLSDRHPDIAARALACFSYPEAVIFVAKATASAWAEFTEPSRTRVIYNAPIAPDRWSRGALPATMTLVSVGALCERKGQIDLIEAYKQLPCALRAQSKVAFVGRDEGRYARDMRDRIPPSMRSSITFVGETDDVVDYLSRASVLVHTARSEAFPRVFFEAASAGIPIVATEVGGTGERLRDGESVSLYVPGDIATLASSIARILSDREFASRLVKAARSALVEAWTYEDMIGAYYAEFSAAAAVTERG